MAGAMRDRTLEEIAAYRDERLVELLRIVGSQLGSPVVKSAPDDGFRDPPHMNRGSTDLQQLTPKASGQLS